MIKSFSELVGNTPLIRLNNLSAHSGCEIYGKAEFLNPGSSVKDRAALSIINEAVAKGLLQPGGTIVEGTAGNTGIGLTLVGSSMGFSTVIVIPETQSQEKKDALKNAGARLIQVPAVPYSNENNYIRYSERLARELNITLPFGAFGLINSIILLTSKHMKKPRQLRYTNKLRDELMALSAQLVRGALFRGYQAAKKT